MKRNIILLALLFVANFCIAQKFVLIDETMVQPLSYTDNLSLKNAHKNIFVVETIQLKHFVSALNKILNNLMNDKSNEDLNFIIGNTKFRSIPITISNEKRFDIMMSTRTDGTNVSMHLSNTKNSNAQNIFLSIPG